MIGGDLLFNEYKFNVNSLDGDTMLYHDRNSIKSTGISAFTAVLVLLNSGISNDPFFMSYSFQTGIFQVIVISVLALILTQLSFHIFVKTWSFNGENSYISIWKDVFNGKTSIIPRIILFVAFISLSSVSTNDFLTEYDDLLSYVDPSKFSVFSSKWFKKFVLTFIFFFPSLFHNRFSQMKYISYMRNFLLVVCLIMEAVVAGKTIKENGFDPQKEIVYWGKDFSQTVACFDLFNVVFFVSPFVAMISKDIKDATRSKICKITWATSLTSLVFNLLGGYLGYLALFSKQEDDLVFLSFENQKDIFIIIGKITCLLKTILTNTMYIYINACCLADLFFKYSDDHKAARLTSGVVVWLLAIFITYTGWKLTDLLNLIGSTCFIFLAFILPSVYYLMMYKFRNILWGILSIFEVLVCVTISGIILYYNSTGFIEEYSGVSYF
ncbi:Transmembrane amino acid transporter protein [Trichomonas vaginalis G3]|uniref:Transmembrane amino acid transporter protein n=1 Tax=Trichomonas vaginalis (strain ATCC PRA-98 / G3) TaxID=412133 RepID=A2EW39_TRIV3|nr:amino acid transporter family [Trichomonas vaginalis G3]EAY03125.1 Transmembrane amino acid transporter protein [Trichomonas vaginalis G3]KAI5508298.1 amino acid transporter family [Trichomonas vaginalis G3]|eukprot:XP_001315348.1 Transmembrane amino acid transporter protein [Trichomonas vaginalis G3]